MGPFDTRPSMKAFWSGSLASVQANAGRGPSRYLHRRFDCGRFYPVWKTSGRASMDRKSYRIAGTSPDALGFGQVSLRRTCFCSWIHPRHGKLGALIAAILSCQGQNCAY